jgi:hypothetical protein
VGRKPRKCRICKKRPVWKGGDVKSPGPFCKKCYHKKVWPNRMASRQIPPDEIGNPWADDSDEFYHPSMDPDYDWRSIYGNNE